MKSIVKCLVIALLMAGCVSRYPLGLSQQQWEALSSVQQADFQAKQYAINEERSWAEEARRLEQVRRAAETARAERDRLRQVYANAHYGDIVQVAVQGGFIAYAGKRYPYEPVSFDLAKGGAEAGLLLRARLADHRDPVQCPAHRGREYNLL